MNAVRRLLVRLHIGRSDDEPDRGAEPQLETTDGWAAAHSRDLDPSDWGAEGGGLPPNYVKSYDEGRPRK
jgi:hypothetical protein